MAFEQIIQKIIADAQEQARQIEEQTRAEVARIEQRFAQEKQAFMQKALQAGKKKAAEEKQKIIVLERLELRKKELAARGRLIDQVFEQAFEDLGKLSEQDYLDLLQRMLLASVETGTEELILSPQDRAKISEEYLKEVNLKLSVTGKQGDLKLSAETRPFKGGFVLRRGQIECNNTFAALFKEAREKFAEKVKEILFETETAP